MTAAQLETLADLLLAKISNAYWSGVSLVSAFELVAAEFGELKKQAELFGLVWGPRYIQLAKWFDLVNGNAATVDGLSVLADQVKALAPIERGLSLYHVAAALVVVGCKRIETRSWPAPKSIRGERVAIHACPARNKAAREQNRAWLKDPDAVAACEAVFGHADDTIETGVIVGSVVVVSSAGTLIAHGLDDFASLNNERQFGDYSFGRFAWKLVEPKRVDPPVECRGGQRVWYLNDSTRRQVNGLVTA